MEKILTKDEIADLLSAVRHGEIDVDDDIGAGDDSAAGKPGQKRKLTARDCNLFKADGPDNWKLKNYDLLLDSFARNYALALSTRFQRAVHVKLEAMESMVFDALLQRLSGRGAIGVMQLEPLSGGGLLIFDEQLSFSLVEMVLGGSPGGNMVIPDRGMSAIELNVMREVINSACPELNKGFKQLQDIEASLVEAVSNLRLLNFVSAEVGVIAARFRVTIDNVEGSISLVIPHTTLEPLQKKQQSKAVPDSLIKGSKWQKVVCDELEHMKVEIEAQLGSISLCVRDILNFQVGDVVELDFNPEAPLKIMVEQRPKFHGVAGVQNGKKAIRILGRIPQGG